MTVLASLAVDAPARADDAGKGEAVALYEKGYRHLQQGDAKASLAPLERSNELLPSPNTELLIAHALRQLKQDARALERYVHVRDVARARVAGGESRFAPTREDAARWIATLTPRVADVTVNVVAGDNAELLVNGRRVAWASGGASAPRGGAGPRVARTFEEPGKIHVEVRAKGALVGSVDVELAAGEAKLVTIESGAGAGPSIRGADAPEDRGEAHAGGGITPPPIAAWIAGGVGVAGMISFAVAGGVALDAASTLDVCAPRCDPDDADLISARDTGRTAATVANVSVAIGAVGLATGALLWIFLPADGDGPTPSVTLDAGPASIRLRGRF